MGQVHQERLIVLSACGAQPLSQWAARVEIGEKDVRPRQPSLQSGSLAGSQMRGSLGSRERGEVHGGHSSRYAMVEPPVKSRAPQKQVAAEGPPPLSCPCLTPAVHLADLPK